MKVWNVTDGPGFKGRARALMLFGKTVAPGRYVDVKGEQLKNAHKIQKDVAAGMVYIGNTLPDSYAATRAKTKPRFPTKAVRAHGEHVVAKAKPVAKASKSVVVPKVEAIKVDDKVKAVVADDAKSGSKRGK